MIYTAQVPEYSMDQDEAMNMLDECIEKGSTLAMERKGMCLLAFPPETKENRLKAIEILKEASDKGSGDASANLFNAYANGITSYARNEVYVEPNDSLALVYIKKACEQGNQTGKAFVGLYTYNGTKGYTQDKAAGVKMMEEANAMSTRHRLLWAGKGSGGVLQGQWPDCKSHTDSDSAQEIPPDWILKNNHKTR